MALIGISGKIGSGKTTLLELLDNTLNENYGLMVHKKNFADKLKKICFDLTGYYGYTQKEKNIYLEDWGMTVGTMLQKIGTDALRDNFHKDVWVLSTLRDLKNYEVTIIGDVRFKNEVEIIKKKGGAVIRLEGDPANVRKNSNRDLNHISETELDDYAQFDLIYYNTGTLEELKIVAEKIVQDFVLPF